MDAAEFRTVARVLSAPLLAAKVECPGSDPRSVKRPRLLQVLDEGATCSLTVLSGPAGSGKTRLLADWATTTQEAIAWLAIDMHDSDPTQFWNGVLGAIASAAGADFASRLPELVVACRADRRRFIGELNHVLSQSTERLVLVLDDLHLIASEEIHADLQVLIDSVGPHARVVVASRTTPPLGLARRRIERQLCEVRFDDLRFTIDEASDLVEKVIGRSLTAAVANRLHIATDGWAAALYVLAIGLPLDAEAIEAASTPLSERHLSDYLVEEVLAREPADRQRFLLETSILDHLTARRCNVLTGRSDSANVLRELEGSSQFVRRHASSNETFSYHALLRDLLRAELAIRPTEQLVELHRRACDAALEDGDTSGAIHHALAASEVGRAGELIANAWIDFTNRGLFDTVMSWLDEWQTAESLHTPELPDPVIFIVGAWMALHTGRLAEVEAWLTRAESHGFDGSLPDGSNSVGSAVAIVRSSHRRRVGAVDEALRASRTAMGLESDPSSPWNAVAGVGHGAALYWSGDHAAANACFTAALDTARSTLLQVPTVVSLGYLALLAIDGGERDMAHKLSSEGVDLATAAHVAGYDQAAAVFLAAGLCAIERIDLAVAEEHLRHSLDLAIQGAERLLQASAHLAIARLSDLRADKDLAATHTAAAAQTLMLCDDPGPRFSSVLSERGVNIGSLAPALTEREMTVLRFLRSSLTLPEIAAELYVSPNTIKSHAASIRSKLGVSSRDDAVRAAREIGLLPS